MCWEFGLARPHRILNIFPRHILYVGIVGFFFFFFKYMYMYIYMVEVRSAAFVGVRDTFFDEPTDWDIICRYQNKIEFVCFVLLISFNSK